LKAKWAKVAIRKIPEIVAVPVTLATRAMPQDDAAQITIIFEDDTYDAGDTDNAKK
jgi:hypothetical protein